MNTPSPANTVPLMYASSDVATGNPVFKERDHDPHAVATSDVAGDYDCRRCGACCAAFRVSFYWAEADSFGLPTALVEQIGPWYACMAGSNDPSPRCHALAGDIGSAVVCTVYAQRPSPCREVRAGDLQCARARHRYGLPAVVATEGDAMSDPADITPSAAQRPRQGSAPRSRT